MSSVSGAVAIGVPLGTAAIGAVAALAGVLLSRKSSREVDRRWHRETTFDLMDKALARALESDDRAAAVGIAQLAALDRSNLLQPEDKDLLRTVTAALIPETLEANAVRAQEVIVDG